MTILASTYSTTLSNYNTNVTFQNGVTSAMLIFGIVAILCFLLFLHRKSDVFVIIGVVSVVLTLVLFIITLQFEINPPGSDNSDDVASVCYTYKPVKTVHSWTHTDGKYIIDGKTYENTPKTTVTVKKQQVVPKPAQPTLTLYQGVLKPEVKAADYAKIVGSIHAEGEVQDGWSPFDSPTDYQNQYNGHGRWAEKQTINNYLKNQIKIVITE